MINAGLAGTSLSKRLEKIEMPFGEFSMIQNPSEWLSHEAIEELWRIGKGIFEGISLEIREGEYFCNSKAIMDAPEAHRQLLWNLVLCFGDKWKDYLNQEYEPTRSESDVFCLLERLLLESAFYLAWDIKNMNKGLPPIKYYLDYYDDFELGFVFHGDSAIEEAALALMNGKSIDRETGYKIISIVLVSLGSRF